MNYEAAAKNIVSSGLVPDGFNGEAVAVGLACVEGQWWEVAETGCYRAVGGPSHPRYAGFTIVS